jgi:hypothetical protein
MIQRRRPDLGEQGLPFRMADPDHSRVVDHSRLDRVDWILQAETLHGLHKFSEGRWYRLKRINCWETTGQYLGKMRRKETIVGADVVNDRGIYSLQPGTNQFQLGLVSSTIVERIVGEIAGVADEIVT